MFAANWLASIWHTRIDLTAEKRFTLSKPVKKMLTSLDTPVSIDLFLKGNYPSGFKKLGNAAGDILNEFRQLAGNKLKYRF